LFIFHVLVEGFPQKSIAKGASAQQKTYIQVKGYRKINVEKKAVFS